MKGVPGFERQPVVGNNVKYIKKCETCQRKKFESLLPAGFLQELPLPELILEEWTMEFKGLPKSGGYDSIMMVVDRLSKLSHFIVLRHPLLPNKWLMCL